MDNGYSLSDLSAATNGGGFGGNSSWVLIILFALIFGWGGNGFGGGSNRTATADDIQRATDFQALERQNNEGVAATRQGVYDVTGAIKDGNYNILGEMRDIQTMTSAGFSDLKNCCCEQLRAIDGVNYAAAQNTASINATTTAQTQKILDVLAQNKIDALQAQVSELKTQNMFCGIPRINPYGYGVYPYASGCGCGNI